MLPETMGVREDSCHPGHVVMLPETVGVREDICYPGHVVMLQWS